MKEKTTHIYGGISILLGVISLISPSIANPEISKLIVILSGWAVASINYFIIIYILKGQEKNTIVLFS